MEAFKDAAVNLLQELAAGPDNLMGDGTDERVWDDPLVGIAAGNDPLFSDFKQHVGTINRTPAEVFETVFPGTEVNPGKGIQGCLI